MSYIKSRHAPRSPESPPPVRNSGYSQHGASRSKPAFLSWFAESRSAHEDITENQELLRERSRDLYAGGGPLGRGAVDRLALNAVGSGLRLNVRIDPELLGMTDDEGRKWTARVESEFDYWASSKSASYDGQLSFYEMQALAFRSVLLDGECLLRLRDTPYHSRNIYTLCLELIESERLTTGEAHSMLSKIPADGVECDENGRPIAYWVANRNPNSTRAGLPPLEWNRYEIYTGFPERRVMFLLMDSERIGQKRGVPFLAPVIEQLKQLGRYTDAELMAAVISGMYAVFFQHEPRPEGAIGEEEYASEEGLGDFPGLEGISQKEMYGMIMDLPEGVKPVGISPSRPNTSFDAFVSSLLRQIGGCLGIPSELLTLNFTASYSASRGALLEAWKLFRYWRSWFSENFCQCVYEDWLTEAVMKGRVSAPGYMDDDYIRSLYTWAEWTGPSQGQLNPVQEVNAAILKAQHGLSTWQRETSELTGGDFDLNMKQKKREESLMTEGTNVQDKG
ncbi:MAG: phage portal protein [Synergistaceae bacterium]|nr:phage portal protein [Synergistaceae bacterium]